MSTLHACAYQILLLNAMKKILILKATKDICGDEVSLITSHCQLLGMEVHEETIDSLESMSKILELHGQDGRQFDYLYLCTHGNPQNFLADMSGQEHSIYWAEFATELCTQSTLTEDGIVLLACCKGGFFQVACDIFACCGDINYVCGVKWNVETWDLTTGFIVFIHNMEIKNAEPSYAAKKATQATDYTFKCYDRDEFDSNAAYHNHQFNLFLRLGWIDGDGNWIETDATITGNADNEQFPKIHTATISATPSS